VYAGPGPTAHVSGLEAGTHRFQVRGQLDGQWSAWSRVHHLEVTPPAVSWVYLSLLLGAMTFLATALVVFRGARREASDARLAERGASA